MNVIVRLCETNADREAVMRVRFVVFVDEQNVPPELEPDEYDETALHLLAETDAGDVIGTARLVDKGQGKVKIGRVAVVKECRGKYVGDALMRSALDIAKKRGFATAVLDAQTYAIPFYERFGFVAEGPEFDDAGIPHRFMSRPLP